MTPALRQLVRERAGLRCEYCHLPEFAAAAAIFHVEHIIAKKHRGSELSPVQFAQGFESQRS